MVFGTESREAQAPVPWKAETNRFLGDVYCHVERHTMDVIFPGCPGVGTTAIFYNLTVSAATRTPIIWRYVC